MGKRESVCHITENSPESAVCVFQYRFGFQSFLHWKYPHDQRLTELKAQSLGLWRDEAVCDLYGLAFQMAKLVIIYFPLHGIACM